MKAIIAAAILAFAIPAFAHIDGHTPDAKSITPASCYTLAARATWGAYAQTLGAPAMFKYVSYNELRSIFFADAANVPRDGIYVLDDMNADQREEYQRQAMRGYDWAAHSPEAKSLDHEQLMAVFIEQICRG